MSEIALRARPGAAFVLKWVASVIQILGYAATGFGLAPWNVGFFLVVVALWFGVASYGLTRRSC